MKKTKCLIPWELNNIKAQLKWTKVYSSIWQKYLTILRDVLNKLLLTKVLIVFNWALILLSRSNLDGMFPGSLWASI